jgi:DNA-binding IclR family transcriptional regulator
VAETVNDFAFSRGFGSAGIQSIEIGSTLLRALAESEGPLTLTALADATGMPPGKAHKYLASFVRSGLVAQHEAGGRYDLGPFALELGFSAMGRMAVMEIAQPALDVLRDQLGTTVSMAIWTPRGPTIARWAETSHMISLVIRLGTVMPLLTSAFGRIFATFLDRGVTEPIIDSELADPAGLAARAGLRSRADVETMLAEFRARRMAFAEDLAAPQRTALAAPVFDHNSRMVAAIAVIAIQGRLDASWHGPSAEKLAIVANELSRRLAT